MHLQMNLLELKTLAHCVCALETFLLWYHKPLTVVQSLILSEGHVNELGAILSTASSPQSHFWKPELCELEEICAAKVDRLKQSIKLSHDSEQHYAIASQNEDLDWTPKYLEYGRKYCGFPCNRRRCVSHGRSRVGNPGSAFKLDEITESRWNLAANGVQRFILKESLENGDNKIHDSLTSHVRNWPRVETFRQKDWPLYIAFSVMACSYGGLHLAWVGGFVTETEEHLWHISGLLIVATGLATPLLASGVLLRWWPLRLRSRTPLSTDKAPPRERILETLQRFTIFALKIAATIMMAVIAFLYVIARYEPIQVSRERANVTTISLT